MGQDLQKGINNVGWLFSFSQEFLGPNIIMFWKTWPSVCEILFSSFKDMGKVSKNCKK